MSMSTPPSPRTKALRPLTPTTHTLGKPLSTPTRTTSITRTMSDRKKRESLINSPAGSPRAAVLKQAAALELPVQRLQRQSSIPSAPSTPRTATKRLFPKSTEVNNIKVIARFRPENISEKNSGNATSATFIDTESVQVGSESFTFDRVFDPKSSQADVFEYSVTQTVDDLFQGYNGTVLAYGQTGSGKSYTMLGPDIAHDSHKGIIPRITDMIFEKLKGQDSKTEYTLSASYLEIYLEQVKDLLVSPRDFNYSNLQVHEDLVNGIHVRDLTKVYIGSTEDIYRVLEQGTELRATASTDMNLESSRSHAIFQINLTQENPEFGIKRSKLFLVDLAGSEKVAKTGVSGQGLKEAQKINSSLSALGNVINALTDHKSTHIPYRDSKLTRILQESLGGNSRTSLIINCSPSSQNESETLSTLRFGTRAKKIKNKAHINAEPSQIDLINQVEELKRLNENQKVYTKTLEYEINLLKADNQKHTDSITPETSPKVEKVTENTEGEKTKREELLEEELNKFKAILTSVPNLVEGSSSDAQRLQESQSLNKELMDDLEDKCLKLVTVQVELDLAKEALLKEKSITDNTAKLISLEITLDQFSKQLEEVQLQNNQLRRELTTVRKISETRQERIHTLESMVEEYESSSSSSYAKTSLSSSGSYLSKWSKTIKKYAPTTTAPSLRSAYPSDIVGHGVFRTGMDSQMGQYDDPDGSFDSIDSVQDLNISKPIPGRTVSHGSIKRNHSQSSYNSAKSGPRVGLNLNIIKPLRGGNNVIPEQ